MSVGHLHIAFKKQSIQVFCPFKKFFWMLPFYHYFIVLQGEVAYAKGKNHNDE